MKTDRATPEYVRHVAENMRAGDHREFLPLTFAETPEALAELMVSMYADHPAGYSFHDEFGPVGIGAMVEGRPNVVTLLFFATDRFPGIALEVARFTRRRLFPRYRAAGVHRIECVSIDGYDDAHRWINMVGMNREAALPGYGKGGETYHQFAWVKEDLSA